MLRKIPRRLFEMTPGDFYLNYFANAAVMLC